MKGLLKFIKGLFKFLVFVICAPIIMITIGMLTGSSTLIGLTGLVMCAITIMFVYGVRPFTKLTEFLLELFGLTNADMKKGQSYSHTVGTILLLECFATLYLMIIPKPDTTGMLMYMIFAGIITLVLGVRFKSVFSFFLRFTAGVIAMIIIVCGLFSAAMPKAARTAHIEFVKLDETFSEWINFHIDPDSIRQRDSLRADSLNRVAFTHHLDSLSRAQDERNLLREQLENEKRRTAILQNSQSAYGSKLNEAQENMAAQSTALEQTKQQLRRVQQRVDSLNTAVQKQVHTPPPEPQNGPTVVDLNRDAPREELRVGDNQLRFEPWSNWKVYRAPTSREDDVDLIDVKPYDSVEILYTGNRVYWVDANRDEEHAIHAGAHGVNVNARLLSLEMGFRAPQERLFAILIHTRDGRVLPLPLTVDNVFSLGKVKTKLYAVVNLTEKRFWSQDRELQIHVRVKHFRG